MSVEKMKEFINFVYNEIKNGDYPFMKGINNSFHMFGSVGEYFESDIFKDNLKLNKINVLSEEITSVIYPNVLGGYSSISKRLFIYIHHIYTFNESFYIRPLLTKMVFHELGHAVQDQKKNNSFTSIVYQMEDKRGKLSYIFNRSDWFLEIDAEMFAIKNALDFASKYSDIYSDKDINYLKGNLKYNRCLFNNYDYDNLFLDYASYKLKHHGYDSDLDWEKLLFSEDGNIKSIDNIINSENYYKVDEVLIRRFVTSRVFSNSYDINNLSTDSLYYLFQVYSIELDYAKAYLKELLDTSNNKSKSLSRKKIEVYKDRLVDKINDYQEKLSELKLVMGESGRENTDGKKLIRNNSFGYISVISMTIGILLIICMFMLFVILKVRI